MKDYTAKVLANEKLYEGAYALTLETEGMPKVRGGQFAMLTVPPADRTGPGPLTPSSAVRCACRRLSIRKRIDTRNYTREYS